MTKRLLVTGSRRWTSARAVRKALTPYRGQNLTLVAGDARGLDNIALGVWRGWGEASLKVDAGWELFGKAAGGIRNQEMVDYGNYVACLAFPLTGSRGTWDCVARARLANIPVTFHQPW